MTDIGGCGGTSKSPRQCSTVAKVVEAAPDWGYAAAWVLLATPRPNKRV
jgi:hypothetical protein